MENQPYTSLYEARMHDATVAKMMTEGLSLSAIAVQLANEKAILLRELTILKCSVNTQPSWGRILTPPTLPPPHIPTIDPNTPH